MNDSSNNNSRWILLGGDFIALLVAVFLGLQFHQLGDQFLQRFAYTFLPWVLAWLLTGPAVGLFDRDKTSVFEQVWRVIWAIALASPFAALLRAAWLDSAALPLFALIMGLATALAIILWRILYFRFLIKALPANE